MAGFKIVLIVRYVDLCYSSHSAAELCDSKHASCRHMPCDSGKIVCSESLNVTLGLELEETICRGHKGQDIV